MMKNFNIPASLPKNVLYGGVTILILIILYSVYRVFKPKISSKTSPEQAKNEVKNNNLSYSLSNYISFSEKIQDAVNHNWLYFGGTDEDAIYEVFEKLNNIDDLLQLIVAYGKRKYIGDLLIPTKLTLGESLDEDLSSKEITKINEILITKGINYKF